MEPVSVTHNGRESLVVLSADEFKRLKALDTREALYAWELPQDLADALETAEPPAFTAQFDHELEAIRRRCLSPIPSQAGSFATPISGGRRKNEDGRKQRRTAHAPLS